MIPCKEHLSSLILPVWLSSPRVSPLWSRNSFGKVNTNTNASSIVKFACYTVQFDLTKGLAWSDMKWQQLFASLWTRSAERRVSDRAVHFTVNCGRRKGWKDDNVFCDDGGEEFSDAT